MEKHYASIWEPIADVIGDQEAPVHGQNRRTWSEYDNRSRPDCRDADVVKLHPSTLPGSSASRNPGLKKESLSSFKSR